MDPVIVVGVALLALLVGAGGAYFAARTRKPAEAPFDSARSQEDLRLAESRGLEVGLRHAMGLPVG